MQHRYLVIFASLSLSGHSRPPTTQSHASENRSTAIIETTITDHSGADVSSSFQTRIYQQAPSLANISLNNRAGPFVRDIDTCDEPASVFLSSQCDNAQGSENALQSYVVICRCQNRFEGSVVRSIQQGQCEEDEICIQATAPPGVGVPAGRAKMATCVEQRAFTKVQKGDSQWGTLAKSFKSTYLSMVVSNLDISAPMEVDKFTVEASSTSQGTVHSHRNGDHCQDCVRLKTAKFRDDISLLKTSARLLTTGTALAGILWIAVL